MSSKYIMSSADLALDVDKSLNRLQAHLHSAWEVALATAPGPAHDEYALVCHAAEARAALDKLAEEMIRQISLLAPGPAAEVPGND